jgi:hypothetical protein
VAEVVVYQQTAQVNVAAAGPQGPVGPPGAPGSGLAFLSTLQDVNVANKASNSVLYYDQASDKFVADSIYTVLTLTDGGNF